jgi:hypothetical protein
MELLNLYGIMHRAIIISGDIHCSVIHRYGPLYELTSSSLTHSIPMWMKQAASIVQRHNRESEVLNVNSFGMLEFYKHGPTGDCSWRFCSVDEDFEHYMTMSHSFWNERRFETVEALREAVEKVQPEKERKFVKQAMEYLYMFERGFDNHWVKPQFAQELHAEQKKKKGKIMTKLKSMTGKLTREDRYDMEHSEQVHISEWYVGEIYAHNIRDYYEHKRMMRKFETGMGSVNPYDETQPKHVDTQLKVE